MRTFKNLKNYLNKHAININSSLHENFEFESLASLGKASQNQITFFHNPKYLSLLNSTNAKACFIQNKFAHLLNQECIPFVVDNPYEAFAYSSHFFDEYNLQFNNNLLNKKDNSFKIGLKVQIGKNSLVKDNCEIKDKVLIQNNSVIGPNVIINTGTIIHSGCIISNAIIGKDCEIQSGTIIGDRGFGFTELNKIEIKHIGNVILGNNVCIGSNSCIDRAVLDSTIIGNNVRIDNLVQIAHNVIIGDNTIIAAQSGIAGSTQIGNNCKFGGQVGVSGHLKIGNNVSVAAKSGITKNIKDNSIIAGFPAIDINKWKKSVIKLYK